MYHPRDSYRHVAVIHGCLSAFSFFLLSFFAITGLLLNNPQWFAAPSDLQTQRFILPSAFVAELKQQENPSDELLIYLKQQTNLIGRYQSTEIINQKMKIKLVSPAGSTEILTDFDTHSAEISTQSVSTLTLIQQLHQAQYAGGAWHWLVNMTAILILLLAIAGYVLSLGRYKNKAQHLFLTVLSLVVLIFSVWLAI